ncbi:MAG: hybrid sensor histidine kinase/response regulator, partial [Chloroflexota bacterium]
LINDVLDIAKMESGKIDWHMESVAIPDLIDQAVTATSVLLEQKGLTFIQDIETDLPEIIGDRDRLIQVLLNLMSNAIKFTDKGAITCQAKQVNGQILISIADTGMGINEVDQALVFDRFKQVGDTLTDKPQGTGLGLPICKQIVEHHGGHIWVESTLGEGSTFSVMLPMHPTGQDTTAAWTKTMNIGTLVKQLEACGVVPPPVPTEEGQKTILVVDDEAHIRELLRQELEAKGYVVAQAKDGVEAITQAKLVKPDLITLDVMMPEISGFDTAAVLKNDPQTADIPIIILSIVEDQARGYRLGIDNYMKKPIDVDALLTEVESLISQGSSKKQILVVDEDVSALMTLTDVLQAQGYDVTEAQNGRDLFDKAMAVKPDMIILNSTMSAEQRDMIKTLRFQKGLENVLIFLFQDALSDE